MEFLRRQLDDPQAEPCGRCDNCTGRKHGAEVSADALAAARAALGRPGVSFEPRRLWPTGMDALGVALKGRIPVGEQAETGRALGRLSDIGWGTRLRALLGEPGTDGPVPAEVVDAMVGVLADWARGPGGWAGTPGSEGSVLQRPVGVVTMASATRPVLVGSLGDRLAEIGRLPLLGRIEYAAGRPPHGARSNSAQRLHTLAGTLVLSAELKAALAQSPGPVLLVDDLVDSGWTVTVAARLLRRAGAEAVLPLVLALQA
jgi:ATP-dependent DNA helicase RecQ